MKVSVVVPEGVEVEIVRERWMPKGMVVLAREDDYWDGWWVINRHLSKYFPTQEVQKIYQEALLRMGVLYSNDEGG